MKTSKPRRTYYGPFPKFFRVKVHQLLSWGYEDAKPQLQSDDEHEPAITGLISNAIKERLRSPDCPMWAVFYSVHDDPPVEKEGSSGRSRPRVDLIIECTLIERPEYMFEAKRLRKNGFEAGKYVGSDGMGCFVSGLYASRYDEAAMLAYVQSDSLEYWRDQVKNKIDDNANSLRLKPPQRDVKVVDAFPVEWVSEHERESVDRLITIYHILLDCLASANAPPSVTSESSPPTPSKVADEEL